LKPTGDNPKKKWGLLEVAKHQMQRPFEDQEEAVKRKGGRGVDNPEGRVKNGDKKLQSRCISKGGGLHKKGELGRGTEEVGEKIWQGVKKGYCHAVPLLL